MSQNEPRSWQGSRAAGVGVATGAVSHPFAAAIEAHRAGRLADAERLYRAVPEGGPQGAESRYLIGIIAMQLNRLQRAVEWIGKALALNEPMPQWHYNLAVAQQNLGHLEDAAAHYRRTIALKPDFAEAHGNLGQVLAVQGMLAEAAQSYERAASLRPRFAPYNDNLARALLGMGRAQDALDAVMRAFDAGATADTKQLAVLCLSRLRDFRVTPKLYDLVLQAVAEPWGRIADFAHVAAALVRVNPLLAPMISRALAAWPERIDAASLFGSEGLAALAGDDLLRRLLESSPIRSIELERFLATLRATLLGWAAQEDGALPAPDMEHAVVVGSSLAQQCFINEYVFAASDAEMDDARRLRTRVNAALENGAPVPPLAAAALGAYMPLHELPEAERLLARAWGEPVRRLLAQQVEEPRREASIRASIPVLTAIDDRVSRAVRQQYEQIPYPRWVKAPRPPAPVGIDAFLRAQFPLASLRPVAKGYGIDVLIAGCGTGEHPLRTARQFAGARVLAVDLSSAILAYARRKTGELCVPQVEYAQADILHLETIGRTFDLIEAIGVLHHMADPWRGFAVLLSLLRPGGVMNVGLYSALARQDVAKARAFIAERGYRSSADDIRRCRQELCSLDERDPRRAVTKWLDFFATSDCRDLLFHVQEHCLTLPQIKTFLAANKLNFLGFTIDADTRRAYAQRFPQDAGMTDLDRWHMFETENPKTFLGMYQIWLQKKDAA
jgi:SAM-dependent methyltransferase/tetratricopeptide (TPR) repeat protein